MSLFSVFFHSWYKSSEISSGNYWLLSSLKKQICKTISMNPLCRKYVEILTNFVNNISNVMTKIKCPCSQLIQCWGKAKFATMIAGLTLWYNFTSSVSLITKCVFLWHQGNISFWTSGHTLLYVLLFTRSCNLPET